MPLTYNPILGEESAPKRAMFQHRHGPEPGVAMVVHREGRPLVLLRDPSDRLTAGEAWWGSIKTIYRVDVSDHKLELVCELPCEAYAFHFAARVQVTCQVADPVMVVERRITDATQTLEKVLTDAMRDASRRFRVEQADEAELAIRAALVERERTAGFSAAFRLDDIVVELDLEEAAREHIRLLKEEERAHERTLQALIRQKEVEISRAGVEQERDRLKGERDKLLAELDKVRLYGEAEVAQARDQLTHEIDRQRARAEAERKQWEVSFEGELQQQRDGLEFERDQLKGEREELLAELERAKVAREGALRLQRAEIEAEVQRHESRLRAEIEIERLGMYTQLYAPLIEQGDWGLLALQLAQSSDPDAIAKVVRMVREQRDADLDRQLATLKLLLEQDALEGAQIAQIASEGKQVLERLIRSWGRAEGKTEELPAGQAHGDQQQAERQPEVEAVVESDKEGKQDGGDRSAE